MISKRENEWEFSCQCFERHLRRAVGGGGESIGKVGGLLASFVYVPIINLFLLGSSRLIAKT